MKIISPQLLVAFAGKYNLDSNGTWFRREIKPFTVDQNIKLIHNICFIVVYHGRYSKIYGPYQGDHAGVVNHR